MSKKRPKTNHPTAAFPARSLFTFMLLSQMAIATTERSITIVCAGLAALQLWYIIVFWQKSMRSLLKDRDRDE